MYQWDEVMGLPFSSAPATCSLLAMWQLEPYMERKKERGEKVASGPMEQRCSDNWTKTEKTKVAAAAGWSPVSPAEIKVLSWRKMLGKHSV